MRPTILYPAWLNRDFAKDLGAEDRWANFWEQVPDVANQRHPISNLAMTCADWDRDPGNFDLNFRPARREDPFFDQDLIEYVVSLASLPWFHRKTLIRSLGQRLLPPAVVKRKKTPPEDLFDCNLRKIDLARFNRISSSPILTSIVDLSKWDWLHPGMKKDLRYVNFRVLALSRWLEEMEGHSVSGLAGYS